MGSYKRTICSEDRHKIAKPTPAITGLAYLQGRLLRDCHDCGRRSRYNVTKCRVMWSEGGTLRDIWGRLRLAIYNMGIALVSLSLCNCTPEG